MRIYLIFLLFVMNFAALASGSALAASANCNSIEKEYGKHLQLEGPNNPELAEKFLKLRNFNKINVTINLLRTCSA